MKKLFMSLLVVLLFTAGCSNQKNDSFEISLDSNPSTGYSWSKELSETGIVEVTSRYDSSGCPKNVEGCGGKQIYTVKALKPGKVTLTLTYKFAYGDSDRDSFTETAIYQITVDNDLKISEEHSGNYFD